MNQNYTPAQLLTGVTAELHRASTPEYDFRLYVAIDAQGHVVLLGHGPGPVHPSFDCSPGDLDLDAEFQPGVYRCRWDWLNCGTGGDSWGGEDLDFEIQVVRSSLELLWAPPSGRPCDYCGGVGKLEWEQCIDNGAKSVETCGRCGGSGFEP